jgi:hypothetical protein
MKNELEEEKAEEEDEEMKEREGGRRRMGMEHRLLNVYYSCINMESSRVTHPFNERRYDLWCVRTLCS